jgi:hypothetical protein
MSDEQTPMAVGAPGEGEPVKKAKGWPKGKPRAKRASSKANDAKTLGEVQAEIAAVEDALKAGVEHKPIVQVTSRRSAALERRLSKGANPHATSAKVIPLKDPHRWQLYIGNDYAEDDGLYRIVHEYGWLPLAREDLACKPEEIGFRVNESGHLVRGPQGREVVFKMDKADYAVLQQRKSEANMRGIGSASKTRQQVAEAAASQFGAEAGEYIHKSVTGTVTDTREALP